MTHGPTEPLVAPVRRVLPSLRLGQLSIDLASTAVFLAVVLPRARSLAI